MPIGEHDSIRVSLATIKKTRQGKTGTKRKNKKSDRETMRGRSVNTTTQHNKIHMYRQQR